MAKRYHTEALNREAFFWIKGLIYAVLLTLVFREGLLHMIGRWKLDDFTYCYVMPLVVLYLLWEKREKLGAIPAKPSWPGISITVLGLILFWLGELGGEFFTLYFAWWVTLVGITFTHLGWKKGKVILFALLMIPAMFPLPSFILFPLSLKLKLLSSRIGTGMMQLYGLSAFRQGNVIDLGFTQLQVVDACNGIRYLFPMFILGILLAYSFTMAFWKKVLLLISVFPIVVFSNSLRIALTGVLYQHWGATVAEGFFHDFAGWFIFMCSLAVLMGEIWVFKKTESHHLPPFESGVKTVSLDGSIEKRGDFGDEGIEEKWDYSNSVQTVKTPGRQGLTLFSPPQFIVTVILLSITLGLAHGVEFRENIPIKKSFNQFPLEIAGWNGKRQIISAEILNQLDLSEYIIADYTDPNGRLVNLYVAYYDSQRKGESIHSPASCLPGGGWAFKKRDRALVPVPGYGKVPVNRVLMERSGARQLTCYWFVMRGRALTSNFEIKMYNFWDALTKHRTDGALIRLITPLYDGETEQDASLRMYGFMGELLPLLKEYISE